MNRLAERSHGHVGEDLEGEQAVLLPGLGVEYVECDAHCGQICGSECSGGYLDRRDEVLVEAGQGDCCRREMDEGLGLRTWLRIKFWLWSR